MKLSESKYVKLQTTQKCEFYYCLQNIVPFQKGTKPELYIIFSLRKKQPTFAMFLDFPLISIHLSYSLQSQIQDWMFHKAVQLRWKFQTYKSNPMLSEIIAK